MCSWEGGKLSLLVFFSSFTDWQSLLLRVLLCQLQGESHSISHLNEEEQRGSNCVRGQPVVSPISLLMLMSDCHIGTILLLNKLTATSKGGTHSSPKCIRRVWTNSPLFRNNVQQAQELRIELVAFRPNSQYPGHQLGPSGTWKRRDIRSGNECKGDGKDGGWGKDPWLAQLD